MANTDGKADMAGVIAAIRSDITANKLPEGFFTSLEGTFQAQEEASKRIAILSLLSFAMVFALLYSRYRSALLAFIIMAACLWPYRVRGGALALGPTLVCREHDRLHHIDRHRDSKWHSENQPLH